MVLRLPDGYRIDPTDPRAPPADMWAGMSAEERARVVAELPSDFSFESLDAMPPEGDPHRHAATGAESTLDAFFRRMGRKLYISSNLAVFYPGERCFAPDVLAVRDVEPHERQKWVVDAEGKGLDFVIEVLVAGDRHKDEVVNVERYASLGIREYFFFDRGRLLLRGYRLPSGQGSASPRIYRPIVPQQGRLMSEVLGLELVLEGDRLRFFHDGAVVLEASELVERLDVALKAALDRADAQAERARTEAERARTEAERARTEAERAARLERELAEARAEIARLKGSKPTSQ